MSNWNTFSKWKLKEINRKSLDFACPENHLKKDTPFANCCTWNNYRREVCKKVHIQRKTDTYFFCCTILWHFSENIDELLSIYVFKILVIPTKWYVTLHCKGRSHKTSLHCTTLIWPYLVRTEKSSRIDECKEQGMSLMSKTTVTLILKDVKV